MNKAGVIQDAIPQEDFLETSGPNEAGMVAQRFFAFNTAITLQAFAPEQACLSAFGRVRKEARRLERLFSRTLPHVSVNIFFTISTNIFSPIAPPLFRRPRQRGCAASG